MKNLQEKIKNQVLDQEELEIEAYLSPELIKKHKMTDKEKERYSSYAIHTIKQMKKRKAISIRIFEEDLIKIKAKAQRLGIPYQTYLTSQIHKIAHG